MADPTPTPTRLSLQERQLVADTLEAQNPIARAEIYRRLQPEDETWIRGALGDPVPPTTAQQIKSGVTTGLTDAARYARDNPVKTGAMIGGIALPAIATGGASVPVQIALAGLGGAGGAGYGALTGALTGAPEVMQPSMSTVPGVYQRVGTEGLGQMVASALGHGVTAGVKGSANVLQRAGLPDQLAREFPTLAETLNQYWINPATPAGLARSKILRKDATGAMRDVVDAGIARGERGIVESDLARYMRPSLQQAREENMIQATPGRAIIKKQIEDLMGQQPMGTFPLTPPPYPLQGATSNVIPGSPPTPQPWWRGMTSNVIPGSPPGAGGGLGAAGGGGAAGGAAAGGGSSSNGVAPWLRRIFRPGSPTTAAGETLAVPEGVAGGALTAPALAEAPTARAAFQPTSPAIAPRAGEVVEPNALRGIQPGQPWFQPTSPTVPPRIASGPIPPTAAELQPTGLAVAPRAAELVTPGELQAGASGALPGSGDVPAIRPRAVVPESDPLLQPTGLALSDRTGITPRIVPEGLPPGATGAFQPTGLAEPGPAMSVSEAGQGALGGQPSRTALQPTTLVVQGERPAFQQTGITRRVVDAEVVPDQALLQPTGLAEAGQAEAGHVTDMGAIPPGALGAPPPTQPTVSNLPPGAVPNFGGGLGSVPPTMGALPPAGGGSPSMWTPQTTRQEREIPLRRMAAIRRQLFGRSEDVIKANALAQRPDHVSSMAYADLANAVGKEADQRMPGWLDANREIQKFVGTTQAAQKMQNAPITPKRVAAALGVAAPLAGVTGYETHSPLETAAAFTLPFAFLSPANTARTAIALYQAGRLPLAELLQVATPEVLQRFGLTEAPVTDAQGSHDPYAFLDQEAR